MSIISDRRRVATRFEGGVTFLEDPTVPDPRLLTYSSEGRTEAFSVGIERGFTGFAIADRRLFTTEEFA